MPHGASTLCSLLAASSLISDLNVISMTLKHIPFPKFSYPVEDPIIATSEPVIIIEKNFIWKLFKFIRKIFTHTPFGEFRNGQRHCRSTFGKLATPLKMISLKLQSQKHAFVAGKTSKLTAKKIYENKKAHSKCY